jgi:glutaredoxin
MTVEIWGKDNCPYCVKAKALCEQKELDYTYKQLGKDFTREEILETFPGARTFPQIKVDESPIGGYEQLWHLYS